MKPHTTLAQLLLQTRKQQGLSREALAGLAQVSTTFIRDAEKDVANCSFGKLMALMDALGLKWAIQTLDQPQVRHPELSGADNELLNSFANTLVAQRNLPRVQQ
jgi:transcriptional regulator with XRE-family HTH domain